MYKFAWLTVALLCLSGCKFKYTNVGSISNACEMLDAKRLLERVCSDNKGCMELETGECKEFVYTSEVSVHTRKDWKKESEGKFELPGRRERINVNIDTYKKWGIGERRFFVISNEKGNAKRSSQTFYFHLNRSNVPRLLGMTLYDHERGEVVEHAFEYSEPWDNTSALTPLRDYVELVETKRYKK